MRAPLSTCLVLLLIAATPGCDSQDAQRDFVDAASGPASGYTRTDTDGSVIETDPDDWRTSPAYVGEVRISPAFPNPASTGFVTIPFTVTQFDGITGGLELLARDASGRLARLDIVPEASDPGAYIFSFSPGIVGQAGLQRLFIADGQGLIVSYGDVLIQ